VPPFDQIADEHYLPAFERGMAEQLIEIETIANNAEPPTFENTIVAMERSGAMLERVNRVFSNLNSAHTNDRMQEDPQDRGPAAGCAPGRDLTSTARCS
jgi:peptidyl-dipeptidase Dcp